MSFADLLYRRVRDGDHHDIREGDRLLHRARLRTRPKGGDETLEILGIARREHHRVARLHEQGAERTALTAGTDHPDLQW